MHGINSPSIEFHLHVKEDSSNMRGAWVDCDNVKWCNRWLQSRCLPSKFFDLSQIDVTIVPLGWCYLLLPPLEWFLGGIRIVITYHPLRFLFGC
ncbi:hypothetical protein NPIL_162011 [Nephila pilipes]|uniref:Uncharacterized protein n=1 Tax=Nephila pilipes TaxID=299642 RepID=A0A8X6MV28_NEPPI|nr:hypothetical protein NPIL_162011 [Nephila pilipes]